YSSCSGLWHVRFVCDSSSTSLPRFFLFFSCISAHRSLLSFPTRRSSDLLGGLPGLDPGVQPHGGLSVLPALIGGAGLGKELPGLDRKSTRLNSSHVSISYAVFCLKKKKKTHEVMHQLEHSSVRHEKRVRS